MTAEAAPVRAYAYAPPGPAARIPPLWAQPLVLVLLFVAAAAVVMVGGIGVFVTAAAAGGYVDASDADRWWVFAPLLAAFAGVAIALTLWWVRTGERRPLVSAGVTRPRLGDLGWAAGGCAWAIALSIALIVIGGEEPLNSGGEASVSRILGVAAVSLGVLTLLAGMEEVLFRGWALSAIAARTSPTAALVVSSLVFGAAHVYPWEWGDPAKLISWLSFSLAGASFGAIALARGSLWSAIAFHTGYNFLLTMLDGYGVGFSPERLVEGAAEAGTGFDSLRPALVVAVADLLLAAAVVLWWRRGLRRA